MRTKKGFCKDKFHCVNDFSSTMPSQNVTWGGDIGFLVLWFWPFFLFLVFSKDTSSFSDLVSDVVSGFSSGVKRLSHVQVPRLCAS